MIGSGILDVEARVEGAALELAKAYTDLIGLLENGAASVVIRRNGAVKASYPSVYVEAYNLAEYGGRTGNYIGGIRFGAVTYKDDDKSRAAMKQIVGGLRGLIAQGNIDDNFADSFKDQLNSTVSAQASGSEVWFFTAQPDLDMSGANAVFYEEPRVDPNEPENRINQGIIEVTIVCMPSRNN